MLKIFSLARFFTQAKVRYRFQHGSFMMPHPNKELKGGEDALFVSDNVLMVADGEGGWAGQGMDPGLYPKRLAKLVEELLSKDSLKYISNPKELIKEAVTLNTQFGSSTVCVLTLNPQTGLLQAYYIGDSIYAIMNPRTQGYRKAPQQQPQFNFPYQVGVGGANPEQGVLHTYQVGDVNSQEILVVATDGIWDNLKNRMIFQIASLPGQSLAKKAQEISNIAKYFSMLQQYESPFYNKAKEVGFELPKKGKLDNNTIIVAKIIKEEL